MTDGGTDRDGAAWSARQIHAADGVLATYARGLSTRGRPGTAPPPPAPRQDRAAIADRRPAADGRRRARGLRVALGSA
jgi:hypothetical protein